MSQNKKELIRKAAIKVISRDGFYNTKTSKIAEEADVAVGTIYNYFASKNEILEYIFEVEFEKRINYLKEMENKDYHIDKKLSLFVNHHFKEVRENLNTAQILVREKEFPKDSEFSSILNYLDELPSLLEQMLDKAVQKDEIECENTAVTASFIFGGLQGIVEKALRTNKLKVLDDAEQIVSTLLQNGL